MKILGHILCFLCLPMKTWLISVISIAFIFLAIIKAYEVASLNPYFKAEKTLKLQSFSEVKQRVPAEDMDLLELWESILTGRSAPLSRLMKDKYKELGLNHIFTPSGFHLSAVLFPIMKIMKSPKLQLGFLLILGSAMYFLPGFGALKRMILIKANQNIFSLHVGFLSALLLDMFFGTFQTSPLSFTYSFLFIGIIYSGLRGLGLIIWFFFAQILIAYFQGNDISLLLLIFSPFLNFIFTFLMPVLFLLSFPLWDWQLATGLFLLKIVQRIVDVCAEISFHYPTIEVNIMIFVIVIFIYLRQRRWIMMCLICFCASLNLDVSKTPASGTIEFRPKGQITKTIYRESDVTVFFSDGRCRMKLVRGYWFENCSPVKRSSRRKKN